MTSIQAPTFNAAHADASVIVTVRGACDMICVGFPFFVAAETTAATPWGEGRGRAAVAREGIGDRV